jgi:hypothetical protein
VPSGIATDDTTKYFFQDLMGTRSLASLYDFENRAGLFPDVDSRMKFCLLTLTGVQRPAVHGAEFVFFAHSVEDLHDKQRRFTLAAEDLALLNPNTRTCPVFRCQHDAELTKAIYRRVPVFIKEGPPEENPWGIRFSTMFHMSNDSSLFRTREQLEAKGWILDGNIFQQNGECHLPLYEPRLFHQFDHRWATYEGGESRAIRLDEKMASSTVVMPNYWVSEAQVGGKIPPSHFYRWLLGCRRITNVTNERTIICTHLALGAVGDNALLLFIANHDPRATVYLCANLNSFILDYCARQKMTSAAVNPFYLKQFPVVPPQIYSENIPWASKTILAKWLLPRVLELTYTAWDLSPFAQDCGYNGPPFRWDEARRFLLRCELDAAYFHLYGISRNDVDYIMEAFPIVKRKDEAQHGEYRTKRVILEMYDAMQHAIDTGEPYQTRLDPPPGPAADGLPAWRSGAPCPGNWPSHMHAPRSETRG